MVGKNMWRVLLLMFAYVDMSRAEGVMQTWITEITNKTPVDYAAFIRCKAARAFNRAASVAEAADWGEPIVYLYAGETARLPVLIKDAYDLGCQIKIAPAPDSPTYPTYYIKGGMPTSGNCWLDRFDGPYSIHVALTERDLYEFNPKRVKMFRYCGVERTTGTFIIEPDGITLQRESRMLVLDAEKLGVHKIPLKVFKGVEREK